MGYIDKTVSKDEVLIKQAKICKMSFFDRYLTAVLYLLGGVFGLVNIFVKLEAIQIGEQKVAVSSLVCMGIGLIILAFMLLLAIYRLVQAIGKVDKDAVIPASVFSRLAAYGLVGIIVGAGVFAAFGDAVATDIVIGVFGLVFGGLVLLFAILRYKGIKLVVTDKRVFGRRNIWLTKSFDLPIGKIDNVVIVFSFWGKMFNYATVVIKSVMGEYKIKYVKSPEEFKNLVMDFAAKANQN